MNGLKLPTRKSKINRTSHFDTSMKTQGTRIDDDDPIYEGPSRSHVK